MNEKDLSSLSYKELQALAVKYRVPGNIKKHLLILVLQAVKNGNEAEVSKILGELHQARKKKRLKKLKRDKMSVISTPINSPNYAMSEDCYYPQQQPPYQWVGAVEEIASRDEDPIRVPDYEEFERFLLHKIQRDYQTYALNDNAQTQVSTIVDLRMGAGSSSLEPMVLDPNRSKTTNPAIDNNSYPRACQSEGEAQMSENTTNGNNQGPVLLKKMLEAPAGANLGDIASPDRIPYRIWSSERYLNSNNILDDSGTLTADSDIDNDDTWPNNNNINGSRGYYCLVNNNKNATCVNQANSDDRTFQDAQLTNNYLTDGTNHYHVVYPNSDVQANCQKWIATNSFGRDANYSEQITENSRGFNPIYYEENSVNSTTTRPINLERKNQYNVANQNLIYEANQTILQGQISNDPQNYYPSNNCVTTAPVNPIDVYYSQQMAKRVADNNQEFFGQASYGNSENLENPYQTLETNNDVNSDQFNGNAYNKENESCITNVENNGIQYNAGYYQNYQQDHNQNLGGFNYGENPNQQEINQSQQPQQQEHQQQHHHHHHNREQQQLNHAVQDNGDRKKNMESQNLTNITNGVLNPFWPRWPINGSLTSDGQLEPILNLHHCNYVDYTKIDQTSCVYCYAAPLVTQRIDAPNTFCTEKKRLVAECRQHVFSPNRLVYNDASTGMRMSNISELSTMEICPAERLNSSEEAESETIVGSTASSENSINDVWIHDYSRYPVNTDNNGPHGLIIDENEGDLFAL